MKLWAGADVIGGSFWSIESTNRMGANFESNRDNKFPLSVRIITETKTICIETNKKRTNNYKNKNK